jgi:hypothetical protein
MYWKEKVEILEQQDDFDVAVFFMQQIIREDSNNVDAYIFILYRLMYCIIENSCHFANVSKTSVSDIKRQYYDEKESHYQDLYLKYFAQGYEKFSENPEFLFYVAHTAAMACGLSSLYAGIDDVFINKMMDKAALLEPHNAVYQWHLHCQSIKQKVNEQRVSDYVQSIFDVASPLQNELRGKGFLGRDILEMMQYWAREKVLKNNQQ